MCGTILLDPVAIAGLVGRYPANYLMERMPIRNRLSFQQKTMPSLVSRGINPGFPGLSPCIRQVAYALRTRAPVATSIAAVLPLDLHVLSLPLAFILSQDQTLRCIKFVLNYYTFKILTKKKLTAASILFYRT